MNRFKMTLIACALLALAAESHATGSKPSTPAPTPAPPAATPVYVGGSPVSSSTAAGGHALSGSVSGAQSGSSASSGASVGDVNAAGGQGGVGAAAAAAGDSTSGSNLTSRGGDTRAIGLSFAPGAATPPLPTNGICAVTITQSSFNVGMGLWSAAKSSSDPRICHLIEQRNRFERMCLFASMKQVDDMLTAELMPGFKVPETMYAIVRSSARARQHPGAPG